LNKVLIVYQYLAETIPLKYDVFVKGATNYLEELDCVAREAELLRPTYRATDHLPTPPLHKGPYVHPVDEVPLKLKPGDPRTLLGAEVLKWWPRETRTGIVVAHNPSQGYEVRMLQLRIFLCISLKQCASQKEASRGPL
jgi:hypothetical protein